MYAKRIKIFVIFMAVMLAVCLLRLVQMQLISRSFYHEQIAELKLQRARSRQLRTIRGRILDRKARPLAADEPKFQLCINYQLFSLLDGRVRPKLKPKALREKLDDLTQIVGKCARFSGTDPCEIKSQIRTMNNFVWNRRLFQAWRTNFPDSQLIQSAPSIASIKLSDALADFEKLQPDPVKRLRLANQVNIEEMHVSQPLLRLETDDDIFTAQLEFLDFNDLFIASEARRFYPFDRAAAQTIGWVGRPQEKDKELFEDDRLASYLEDDIAGREDGAEYVCEAILRGRRGKRVYDIDRELITQIPTRFGKDVTLTLDITLQQRIENYLIDCTLNTNCEKPSAAVVIDVDTAEILALVSVPVFDLNRVRSDWDDLNADPDKPMINRAINGRYPPGSVIKPIILIAGLEEGKIAPDTPISCPTQIVPKPRCWLFNRFGLGHDGKWPNIARNAIKGSCNIYFSRLAERIEPHIFQQWLLAFGYGKKIPLAPPAVRKNEHRRTFRQLRGIVSSRTPPKNEPLDPQKYPVNRNEMKYFGIGQGNLRVTPLQVANGMATIARQGIYMSPRLFMPDPNDPPPYSVDLNISQNTLAVVHDGMSAVVNEAGGTANKEFAPSGLADQGITVYGKTGTTEKPTHAWFGGFATDSNGRSIAIAVIVEGGQHGSSDAAPIARDIMQFAIDQGYIGDRSN
jgi:penicillin-binding protein 2